jgi:hypothetical protein
MPPSNHREGETWRPVVGYEGRYEVSDLGRVRSLDRTVWRDGPYRRHQVTYRGRVRAVHQQEKGYVGLCLWKDGQTHSCRVHQLVLEAFVGPCPEGMEALHGNGVRHDNRRINLRWGTPAENAADRVRHGTTPGANGHCKRGHLLQAPNLRPRKAARDCLACSRAVASWHWMERTTPGHGADREPWIQKRSDRNYALIMQSDYAA